MMIMKYHAPKLREVTGCVKICLNLDIWVTIMAVKQMTWQRQKTKKKLKGMFILHLYF